MARPASRPKQGRPRGRRSITKKKKRMRRYSGAGGQPPQGARKQRLAGSRPYGWPGRGRHVARGYPGAGHCYGPGGLVGHVVKLLDRAMLVLHAK